MATSLGVHPEEPGCDAPAAQLARLIHVLDKQPACLIRVTPEGVLLAVNDAALSLLGGRVLGDVFGTSFVERFLPQQKSLWGEFSTRVLKDGSASSECDLVDLAGGKRVVLMQALGHRDDADGGDSLFVALRDISAQRRLEGLVEAAARMQEGARDSGRELEVARAECSRLEERCARLDAAVREKHETAAMVTRRAEGLLERIQLQLAIALAERKRLEAALQKRVEAADAAAADAGRLSEQRAELERLSEAVRLLSPLARARRVTRDVAGELQPILGSLDDRSRELLADTPLAAGHRQELESLRRDALRAAALGRQMADCEV